MHRSHSAKSRSDNLISSGPVSEGNLNSAIAGSRSKMTLQDLFSVQATPSSGESSSSSSDAGQSSRLTVAGLAAMLKAQSQKKPDETTTSQGDASGNAVLNALKAPTVPKLVQSVQAMHRENTNYGGLDTVVEVSSTKRAAMERGAHFTHKKKEITKWQGIIEHNRMSGHVNLAYQMKDKVRSKVATTSQTLRADFHPTNDLEHDLMNILTTMGVDDKTLKRNEKKLLELEQAKDEEDYLRKQEKLGKMRAMVYFQEQKQKHIAKVKSRAQRKYLRQQKQKQEDTALLHTMDDEEGIEYLQEQEEKRERERVRERALLTHRNTSKWAKTQLRRAVVDKTSRQLVQEQIQLGLKLREKLGHKGDDDSNDFGSDSDSDEDQEKLLIDRELENLTVEYQNLLSDESKGGGNNTSGKGLMNLAFMKRAQEKQARENLEAIEDLQQEIALSRKYDENSDSDFQNDSEARAMKSEFVYGNHGSAFDDNAQMVVAGRRMYTAGKLGSANNTTPILTETDIMRKTTSTPTETDIMSKTTSTPIDSDIVGKTEKTDDSRDNDDDDSESDEINPWVTLKTKENTNLGRNQRAEAGSLSHQTHKHTHGPDQVSVSVAASAKPKRDAGKDSIVLDLSNSVLLHDDKSDVAAKAVTRQQKKGERDADKGLTSIQLDKNKQQAALVKLAFSSAHDEADQFEREKLQEIEGELPQEDPFVAGVPGWGSWYGHGIKVSKKQKEREEEIKAKHKAQVEKKRQAILSSRSDKHLKHVIINQKLDKSAFKYQSDVVPFPFRTREQYDASLRVPLGTEWNTQLAFRKMTVPRVVTEAGVAVAPLSWKKEYENYTATGQHIDAIEDEQQKNKTKGGKSTNAKGRHSAGGKKRKLPSAKQPGAKNGKQQQQQQKSSKTVKKARHTK